jgi:response regulator RpfG family c-di-GMP phosphodiesterase
MTRCTILIVDDESIILYSLRNEFRNSFGEKFSYELATSAEDAEELIEELVLEGMRIILIISDWLMPGKKGDELIKHVHIKYPDIKTMIISGHADNAAIKRVREESGLGAFIMKPWNGPDLIDAITGLIGSA